MSTQQNYRPVLRQLLEALVQQPDFAALKEIVAEDELAIATYKACEILYRQTRIRETAEPSSDDDVFFFNPDVLAPQQEQSLTDDFGIIAYGGDAAGIKEAGNDFFMLNPDSFSPQSENDFGNDNFDILEY